MFELRSAWNLSSDLFDADFDDSFVEAAPAEVQLVDYRNCPTCNVPGKIAEAMIICEQCGLEREWNIHYGDVYSQSYEQNYNVSENSFIKFNIVGIGAHKYQKAYISTCADYSTYRANVNKTEIIQRINMYTGILPPSNAINMTIDLFEQIKRNEYVYRGNSRWGVIGACLYYACMDCGVSRTMKDIASIINIEKKALSQGDKILQDLHEAGVINILVDYEPLDDYLNQYLPALGIPVKYKAFIKHIIDRAEKKHLYIRNESQITSKCVGAIYLLIKRVPELRHLQKNIPDCCNNMSKSTYNRQYKLMTDNIYLLKKSFKKFGIPMDKAWKNVKSKPFRPSLSDNVDPI